MHTKGFSHYYISFILDDFVITFAKSYKSEEMSDLILKSEIYVYSSDPL
jgi:hypothetical protein